MESQILNILINIILFILSALPLRRATKILKIKTKFSKLLLIVFISGIIISIIEFLQIYAGLLSFIAIVFVYKKTFKIKYPKAFLLWIIQLIVILISKIIINIILTAIF